METHPYVKFRIQAYQKGKRDETLTALWVFDMPRQMYHYPHMTDRLGWITARFRYFNPRLIVTNSLDFYDKKSGLDMGVTSALTALSTAKAQITKIENAIERDKKLFKPTLFLKSLEDTAEYKLAIEKLNRAKSKLFEAECRLNEEKQKLENQDT